MNRTPRLEAAIEELYRVFASYPLAAHTDPCVCCHGPDDEKVIHSKPLRNLDERHLYNYASDALYTWGNEADFKHFLPRIFELMVLADSDDFVDAEAIFAKLSYATWRTWPTIEQDAILRFVNELWSNVVNTDPEDLASDGTYGWLCAIAQAEDDLSPYLEQWVGAPSLAASRNLAQLVSEEGLPFTRKPTPGYWDGRRDQWQQIVDWLGRPEPRHKLERAFEEWSSSPFGEDLFAAANTLRF
jgi:hypothetical protein